MMEGKKQTRSTNVQLQKLAEYMSLHSAFAKGEYSGASSSKKIEEEWSHLKDILKELGPDKSIEQWKQTWRDLKRKARQPNAKSSAANANTRKPDKRVPLTSKRNNIILCTISHDSCPVTSPNDSGTGRRELLLNDDAVQSVSNDGVGSHFAKFRENTEVSPLESTLFYESNTERPLSRESTSRTRRESYVDPLSDGSPINNRQLEQMEEDFPHFTTNRDNETMSALVECDLYGQLLVQKLKSLDVDERLVLMNDIDNLVFKHMINIRKRSKKIFRRRLSSMNHTHSDTRQAIGLPEDSSPRNMLNCQSMSNYDIPIRIFKPDTEVSPRKTSAL